jgi:micrococcal nuclease
MSLKRFCYGAKIEKVVDGDTVDLIVDLGFDVHHKIRVRLHGVDAPETRTVNKAEKEAGLKAKEFVKSWSETHLTVLIETVKDKNEKYGRVLAKIYADENKSECLNERLISEGLAKAYFGDKKEVFNG